MGLTDVVCYFGHGQPAIPSVVAANIRFERAACNAAVVRPAEPVELQVAGGYQRPVLAPFLATAALARLAPNGTRCCTDR